MASRRKLELVEAALDAVALAVERLVVAMRLLRLRLAGITAFTSAAFTVWRMAFVGAPDRFWESLIYQVPAMILERPTIVVSPLIASWSIRSAP